MACRPLDQDRSGASHRPERLYGETDEPPPARARVHEVGLVPVPDVLWLATACGVPPRWYLGAIMASPTSSLPRESAPVAMVAATVLLVSTAAGCGGEGPARGVPEGAEGGSGPAGELTVAVSVPPQAFLVERLTGGAARRRDPAAGRPSGARLPQRGPVSVRVMVPPGASPRTYEPTLRQMRALSDAEIYFAVGHPNFPFERAWLDELLEVAPEMRIVDTGARCPPSRGDPHLWLSPTCAGEMAGLMAEALARARPARAEEYRGRLTELRARIDSVEAVARGLLEPHRGRAFLVYHPAWGYFAREFGLRQLAVEAGGKQPSPHELSRLVQTARRESVGVIFVQPQFTMEPSRTIARTIGADVEVLDPLARDWPSTILGAASALDRAFRP